MSLALVPTQIAQLLADPSLASTVPRPDRVSLAVAMIASLAGSEVAVPPPIAKEPDRPISMRAAAERIGVAYNTFGSGGASRRSKTACSTTARSG